MYKRVVVPLDGSRLAEEMLRFVVDIAGPLDLEVVLLRVIRVLPRPITETVSAAVLDNTEYSSTDALEYLAPLVQALKRRGIRVRTQVRRGEPVEEIVDCAREVEADLIAMTTHGRSGLGRWLFGSVAEAVLREAEIPVFLMRMTEAQVAAGEQRPVLA